MNQFLINSIKLVCRNSFGNITKTNNRYNCRGEQFKIRFPGDLFSKFFFDTPNDAASFIDKPQQFIFELKKNTTTAGVRSAVEEIKKIVDLKKSAKFE